MAGKRVSVQKCRPQSRFLNDRTPRQERKPLNRRIGYSKTRFAANAPVKTTPKLFWLPKTSDASPSRLNNQAGWLQRRAPGSFQARQPHGAACRCLRAQKPHAYATGSVLIQTIKHHHFTAMSAARKMRMSSTGVTAARTMSMVETGMQMQSLVFMSMLRCSMSDSRWFL